MNHKGLFLYLLLHLNNNNSNSSSSSSSSGSSSSSSIKIIIIIIYKNNEPAKNCPIYPDLDQGVSGHPAVKVRKFFITIEPPTE